MGLRRSASMSSVLRPDPLKEVASISDVVVFPSPGRAEVTCTTFGDFSISAI